ncbi:LysE family transporter [Microbacterium paludicola]|uniref:Lysine transporter LysE n=1 Tax=Microbacterium paludicola TaxID=300019 RepID=A0A4Y9FY28_9MICO|nr:LysE family transporter [Microbacterium paludicola]MBF0815358.1 LysE family transporter [Microbacterium paludicola]TFU34215.1 lysine transporter LysE [Microbacterium paludicola]
MTLSLWLALVGAGALISLTPGAGAVNTMSNAIASGWRRSLWGILGQQVALVVHIVIVAAGVGVLVASSPILFEVIRYAGAAYLIYLGVRQFLARPQDATEDGSAILVRESAWSMFRRGLLVNLTNPKAIVFFLAFVPQFIRPDQPLIPQYTVLSATVVAIDIAVMWFVFAIAARGLARLTRTPSGQKILGRIFGSLFVGVGVLLAAVH